MKTEPEYFATPDPLDPAKVSYWYRPSKGRHAGELRPWPPRRSQWGKLRLSDVPFDRDAEPMKFRAFVDAHFLAVGAAEERARRAIEADPQATAARFAAFTVRCCYCGKTLTGERSKVYGVGPECRTGIDPAILAAATEAVRAAHGETLAHVEVRA